MNKVTDQGTNEPDGEPSEEDMTLPKGHWIHDAMSDAKVAHAAKAIATAGMAGRSSTAPDQGQSKDQYGKPIPKNVGESEPDMEPDDRMFLGKSSR